MPRFAVAVLIALVAATAAAPARAQGVTPPAVKPGDRWVYDNNGGKRTLKVDKVDSDGTIDATVDSPGLSGFAIKFTREWNVLMAPVVMLGSVRYQRYSPPACLMPAAPWNVGQSWTCDANWSDGTYSGTAHIAGSIAGVEKIAVPAGTFDALHVKLNVGGTEVNCWYAQAVASWAQCKSALADYNYSLLSFSLK